MSLLWAIALPLVALFALFVGWYGGRGKPLGKSEADALLTALSAKLHTADEHDMLDNLRALAANDDGREFVMQNLVRYRAKALYPEGSSWGSDPREADRRYGKAILWPLLRQGSLVLFVAPRRGEFVKPEGADDWHYVAMVRYRSLRDFLQFALRVEQGGIVQHKWAAIEKTHVFPVKPLISLFMVRGAVAALLTLLGLTLYLVIR